MRPARPESAWVHSVAIGLHFANALSPADLLRHLSKFVPHSLVMQTLYRYPQSTVWLYNDNRIACFLSSLISGVNALNSCAVHVVFFLHDSSLSEKVVSESVSQFL